MMVSAGMAGYLSFQATPPAVDLSLQATGPAVDPPVALAKLAAVPTPPLQIETVGGPGYVPPEATNLPAEIAERMPPSTTTPTPHPPLPTTAQRGDGGDTGKPSTADEPSLAEAPEERRRQIMDAFRDAMPGFRECYELILELEPDLDDRVVFEFVVSRSSAGEPVTEVQSIEAGRMQVEHLECFEEAARSMAMPLPAPGEENYTIRYPMVLSAR